MVRKSKKQSQDGASMSGSRRFCNQNNTKRQEKKKEAHREKGKSKKNTKGSEKERKAPLGVKKKEKHRE